METLANEKEAAVGLALMAAEIKVSDIKVRCYVFSAMTCLQSPTFN